jgi:hypothetical protein
MDGESTGWLLKEFRGHRPPVVGMKEPPHEWVGPKEVGPHVLFWTAYTKTIGNHHATVLVRHFVGIGEPGGAVTVLELHRGISGWVVGSERAAGEERFPDRPPRDQGGSAGTTER